MGALTPLRKADSLYSPSTLALIKRTVAADCNDDEFNLFCHMAQALRLDPLRRQIYAFVFSKDKPDKRRMSIIVGIDGFRAIADRTGNYRPDENEPAYVYDDALKGPLNPAGLVRATVRVHKFSHGQWHLAAATAKWDEYAPLKDVWAEDPDTGRRRKTGGQELDTSGNWGKMPELMLAKVAEALALRKAWPDDFSNVYAAEEIDRARVIDATPAELAEQGEVERRMDRIGGPALTVDWLVEHAPLDRVPVGQFADRAMAFIEQHRDEPSAIMMWSTRNRHCLKEFWSHCPSDALAIKRAIEAATSSGSAS